MASSHKISTVAWAGQRVSRPGAPRLSVSGGWTPSQPQQRRLGDKEIQQMHAMSSARATGGGGAAAAAAAAFTASEAGREPPSTSLQPIFYTHVLCPYAERESVAWLHCATAKWPLLTNSRPPVPAGVWLALLEKGVTFHLCHIDLSSKPAWYRRINSRGLVPAVQHAGQVG